MTFKNGWFCSKCQMLTEHVKLVRAGYPTRQRCNRCGYLKVTEHQKQKARVTTENMRNRKAFRNSIASYSVKIEVDAVNDALPPRRRKVKYRRWVTHESGWVNCDGDCEVLHVESRGEQP